MDIGIVGLGKMGLNLALNLKDHKYNVVGMDVSSKALEEAAAHGIPVFDSLNEFVQSFRKTRIIWLMLPAGDITEESLQKLKGLLSPEDVIIEGGNANFKDSIRRAEEFRAQRIGYLDCGTSGGLSGARNDACLMIGGDEQVYLRMESVFKDLSGMGGYLYAGPSGSGHFLKMVHNGIEYGMMQSIGEGFQILEESNYSYDLEKVAGVWNHGSVIRGWLMEIAEEKFSQEPHLETYKATVASSGEAKWTVETALELNLPVPTIALSLFMRNLSQENDNFSIKVVSALRNGFGGHEIIQK